MVQYKLINCRIVALALCRFSGKPPRITGLYYVHLVVCILLLNGCALTLDVIDTLPLLGHSPDSIKEKYFLIENDDDVVGRLAVIKLKKGDTLPDIARHFSLGINTVNSVNPEVDIWVPKAGQSVVLPSSFILPNTRKKGIVINLAAMRLFNYHTDSGQLSVSTFPVGVGTVEKPTPMGRMSITRKKFRPTWYVPASIAAAHRQKGDPLPAIVPPGPLNPLGEHALYLSRPGYLIHGTNKPASIGLRATNGCIRLYPEDIELLYKNTPAKTPVMIIHQPYLVGTRDGVVYLEAHKPFKESGAGAVKKVYAGLKAKEKKTGRPLDWSRIKKVLRETRGVPVAVSTRGTKWEVPRRELVRIRHPGKLYGKPEVPELRTDAWYLLAAEFSNRDDAGRLSAIINHQGPPIPARVLSKNYRYRVLVGPFLDKGDARKAAKRLKIDLELDALFVEPVKKS